MDGVERRGVGDTRPDAHAVRLDAVGGDEAVVARRTDRIAGIACRRLTIGDEIHQILQGRIDRAERRLRRVERRLVVGAAAAVDALDRGDQVFLVGVGGVAVEHLRRVGEGDQFDRHVLRLVEVLRHQPDHGLLGEFETRRNGDRAIGIDLPHLAAVLGLRHAAGDIQHEHDVVVGQCIFRHIHFACIGRRLIVDHVDAQGRRGGIGGVVEHLGHPQIVGRRAVVGVAQQGVGVVARPRAARIHHQTPDRGIDADVTGARIRIARAAIADPANVQQRRAAAVVGKQIARHHRHATARSIRQRTLMHRRQIVHRAGHGDAHRRRTGLPVVIGQRVSKARRPGHRRRVGPRPVAVVHQRATAHRADRGDGGMVAQHVIRGQLAGGDDDRRTQRGRKRIVAGQRRTVVDRRHVDGHGVGHRVEQA